MKTNFWFYILQRQFNLNFRLKSFQILQPKKPFLSNAFNPCSQLNCNFSNIYLVDTVTRKCKIFYWFTQRLRFVLAYLQKLNVHTKIQYILVEFVFDHIMWVHTHQLWDVFFHFSLFDCMPDKKGYLSISRNLKNSWHVECT